MNTNKLCPDCGNTVYRPIMADEQRARVERRRGVSGHQDEVGRPDVSEEG